MMIHMLTKCSMTRSSGFCNDLPATIERIYIIEPYYVCQMSCFMVQGASGINGKMVDQGTTFTRWPNVPPIQALILMDSMRSLSHSQDLGSPNVQNSQVNLKLPPKVLQREVLRGSWESWWTSQSICRKVACQYNINDSEFLKAQNQSEELSHTSYLCNREL